MRDRFASTKLNVAHNNPSYRNDCDGFRAVRSAVTTTALTADTEPIPEFDKELYKEVSIPGEKVFRWVMLDSFVEYDPDGNEIHSQKSSGYEEWYKYGPDGNRIHTLNSFGYET